MADPSDIPDTVGIHCADDECKNAIAEFETFFESKKSYSRSRKLLHAADVYREARETFDDRGYEFADERAFRATLRQAIIDYCLRDESSP